MDKKTLKLIRNIIITSALALILAALIIGNCFCYLYSGFITSHLCPATEIVDTTKVEEANAAGEDVIQAICDEGITLLKNENDVLPLKVPDGGKYKVNLFGLGSTDLFGDNDKNGGFFFTGSGSGGGSVRNKKVTLQDGLAQYGFEYNEELLNAYKTNGDNFEEGWYTSDQSVLAAAKTFSDTAIVTIARMTGENQGTDQELTADTSYQSPTFVNRYHDRDVDGRNAVQLSLKEEAMLRYVGDNFEKVIVLINSGNTMELPALASDKIDAVLYVSHPGQSGTKAIGRILAGKVNPSGHLVDTFVYDTKKDPVWANVTRLDDGYGLQIAYAEGIYVGYRWYETADAEGYFDNVDNDYGKGYDGIVQWPFGHGLSYTSFEWKVKQTEWVVDGESVIPEKDAAFTDKATTVNITVEVTNTGSVAGKDVVQVYYTAPYTKGGIEKSYVNLVGFAKTDLIPAGETDEVTISFDLYDMASYDCYDKNANGFTGYELDPGEYHIKLMNNSHDINPCEGADIVFRVENEGTQTEPIGFQWLFDPDNKRGIVVNRFTGDDAEMGWPIDGSGSTKDSPIVYLSRADFVSTFPNERTPSRTVGANLLRNAQGYYQGYDDDKNLVAPQLDNHESSLYLFTKEDGSKASLAELNRETGSIIPNEELIMELGADYDSPKWTQLLSQLTMDEVDRLVSCAGFAFLATESIGSMIMLSHDGPSGFNRSMVSFGTPDTFNCYPANNLVAMTWNSDLARQEGAAIGVEAQATGESGIYAPTVNLHRSPYHTRNFESYSEDPLISGTMGGSYVRGAQTHGMMCSVKHFALSELGTNPAGVNAWLSEQTLRELYCKSFEIAVKDGGANFIMSTFGNIGGIMCKFSYQLLTGILRQEWGFKGSVITDSDGSGNSNSRALTRAGNDLRLCNSTQMRSGFNADDKADVYCGVQSVKNAMYSYCNTYYLTKTYNPTTEFSVVTREQPFIWWIPTLIAIDVLVAAGMVVAMLFLWKKKKRKAPDPASSEDDVGTECAAEKSDNVSCETVNISTGPGEGSCSYEQTDIPAVAAQSDPAVESSQKDENADGAEQTETVRDESAVASDGETARQNKPEPKKKRNRRDSAKQSEMQKEFRELNDKIDALNAEINELRKPKSKAKKRSPNAPAKPTKTQKELQELRAEIAELKNRLDGDK